eukprot:568963-Rhodomonas_salina.2
MCSSAGCTTLSAARSPERCPWQFDPHLQPPVAHSHAHPNLRVHTRPYKPLQGKTFVLLRHPLLTLSCCVTDAGQEVEVFDMRMYVHSPARGALTASEIRALATAETAELLAGDKCVLTSSPLIEEQGGWKDAFGHTCECESACSGVEVALVRRVCMPSASLQCPMPATYPPSPPLPLSCSSLAVLGCARRVRGDGARGPRRVRLPGGKAELPPQLQQPPGPSQPEANLGVEGAEDRAWG